MISKQSLVGIVTLLFASCSAPSIGFAPRFGLYEADGSLGVAAVGAPAETSLKLAGIDEYEPGGGARIDLEAGLPHFTFSTHLSRHQGTGLTNAPQSDGGVLIPGGSTVTTDLNLGIHTGALTFDIARSDLELGIGFGLVGVEVDGDFTRVSDGAVVATDKVLPVPVIALRAAKQFGEIELQALFTGTDMVLNGDDMRFTDLDLSGSWQFVGGEDLIQTSLVLGYRVVNFDLEYDESEERVGADMELTGPYLALNLSL